MLATLFFLLMAGGLLRTTLWQTPVPSLFAADLRHRVAYEGVVVADPVLKDATARVPVRVRRGEAETIILAIVPRTNDLAVGDTVRVSGTLSLPEAFTDEEGRIFHYDKWLEKDGIRFLLEFGNVRVLQHAPWYSLPASLARIKHRFLAGLAIGLPEPYASLAGGIVIGGKSGLGPELQTAFVTSGLVQIIVLSGYNVMIVADWVLIVLGATALPRRLALVGAAVALLLFVGIAGFSATALRAGAMALIALYARATGRSYAASRALLAVVLLMLVWNPYYLVFDPSFDLSVAATAGLIWLAPLFERGLARLKSPFWINAVATTLAAQASVVPLLLYDMGTLSLVAIPANLLVLPVVPLTMAASAIAGIAGALLGTIMPVIAMLAALPAYLLSLYLILVAEGATRVPFAALTLPVFPFALVVVAYGALIALASRKRFSMTDQLRLTKNASI